MIVMNINQPPEKTFNPYREWLSIPDHQQPPTHYRLLSIENFESDPTVIANAADRAMIFVRTFQTGQHSDESQRLLNEISAARVCLLNEAKKREYDATLRSGTPAVERVSPLVIATVLPPAELELPDVSPIQIEGADKYGAIPNWERPKPELPPSRMPPMRIETPKKSSPAMIISLVCVFFLVFVLAGVWFSLHFTKNYQEITQRLGMTVEEPAAEPTEEAAEEESAPAPNTVERLRISKNGTNAEPVPDITDEELSLLRKVTQLRKLSLRGCERITDAGLEHLYGLTQTQTLYLEGYDQVTAKGVQELKDALPECAIAVPKAVYRLHISKDGTEAFPLDITDEELANFKGMTQLRSLSLWGCKRITDAGLKHLYGLTQMQTLCLEGCNQVTAQGVQKLKDALPKCDITVPDVVKRLGISKDGTAAEPVGDITDAEFSLLGEVTQLQMITLSRCGKITDAGLKPLKELTQLRTLNLKNCGKITDTGLKHLKELAQLRTLYLSDCNKITDGGLAHLQELTRLQVLDIQDCGQVTAQGIQKLKAALPKCDITVPNSVKRLNISKDETKAEPDADITDEELVLLAEVSRLQRINLIGCNQITDAGLKHLTGLTQLQTLDLTNCPLVTVKGVQELKNALPGCDITIPNAVKRLKISKDGTEAAPDPEITDDELALLREMTRLRKLSLVECEWITDAGLRHVRGLTRLERLDLSFCDKITDAGLEHLKEMTQLQTLILSGCSRVTANGVRKLKNVLPECRIIVPLSVTQEKLNISTTRGNSRGNNKTLVTAKPDSDITDSDLALLGQELLLQAIDLSGCDQITDDGLKHLRGLTLLRYLNLNKCDKITDTGLAQLHGLTQLQELYLVGCKQITYAGVSKLKKALPRCKISK